MSASTVTSPPSCAPSSTSPDAQITIANAGHPNPILIDPASRSVPSRRESAFPIGVTRDATYETVTATIPPQATLLAFTDGLFERRGESVDDGLERLRGSATSTTGSLDELLTRIVDAQIHDSADDDTAILGVRWQP